MKTKAIFLDRDGTINEDVNYLSRADEIKLIPGVKEALKKFKQLGFLNIVVTNQSGVARGYLSEEELEAIHAELRAMLKSDGDDDDPIDAIYYSPFHIDGTIPKYKIESEDRKPGTGLIRKAREKFDINLEESFFVGDSFTDMLCAKNAGLKKILVKTGYGKNEYQKCMNENLIPDYFAEDLADASDYIESGLTNYKFNKKEH